MISIGGFPDGEQFKEITPENYVEGPQMFKRKGKYYLFWSEGRWTGPDYAVSYAISDNPIGPFKRVDKILQQDLAVATGSGHNGVITVPGTDIHYIVYHRHPLGSTDGNDRHLAYDRLTFRADGTIEPIVMGVQDNFKDGKMIGWTTYGGSWDASSNRLKIESSDGAKAVLNTDFADQYFSVDVTIPCQNTGDAGIIFRATGLDEGSDSYQGYYLGIGTGGKVVVGRVGNSWTPIKTVNAPIHTNTTYTVGVRAIGNRFNCRITRGSNIVASFTVSDGKFRHGMNGVRAFLTEAIFDSVEVRHA